MWLMIFSSITIIILSPIISIIIKIIKSRYNLKYYEKQGLQTHFSVKYGPFALYSKDLKENKKGSNMEYIKKIVNSGNKTGAIALNGMADSSCVIYLYSSDCIKDFVLKEEFLEKSPLIPEFQKFLGVFFMNGESAMHLKSLFSKIFNYEELVSFTPRICKLINEEFDTFIYNNNISKDEYTKVSLNDIYGPIMSKIADLVIFGREDIRKDEEISKLSGLLNQYILNLVAIRKNPFYVLIGKYALKAGLVPQFRENHMIIEKQKTIMEEYVRYRDEHYKGVLGDCIIDRIITHNRRCKQEGNSKDHMDIEMIVGNYNVFHFAGTDTSQNSTKMGICHMADKEHLKKIVEELAKSIFDSEGITTNKQVEQCEGLDLWVKEFLRLHSPISRTSNRKVLRDIQINGFTVKKGDLISCLTTGLNHDKTFYPDNESFRVDRFEKQNQKSIPRYQYLPFFVGKRVCMGRHLGELMVKLLVTLFVRRFQFEKPEGVEYYYYNQIANMVASPILLVKLK